MIRPIMQHVSEVVDFCAGDGIRLEEVVRDGFDACGRRSGDAGEGLRKVLDDDAAAGGG